MLVVVNDAAKNIPTPAGDPGAVVDARGRVHGLEGLYVADAAIMPVIPRANTNLPCAVIGEKTAALLPG